MSWKSIFVGILKAEVFIIVYCIYEYLLLYGRDFESINHTADIIYCNIVCLIFVIAENLKTRR